MGERGGREEEREEEGSEEARKAERGRETVVRAGAHLELSRGDAIEIARWR
jgi:hypothetical protein